ncbi:hypothetical protein, partial [Adlercreutzia mucosicola]|uniref:hypothetical protein n=1 Tax=Adlercreutzia mucosicola TaxID=580026 RepID=UPI002B24C8C4
WPSPAAVPPWFRPFSYIRTPFHTPERLKNKFSQCVYIPVASETVQILPNFFGKVAAIRKQLLSLYHSR